MEKVVECIHCNSKNVSAFDCNNNFVSFKCNDCKKYFVLKEK